MENERTFKMAERKPEGEKERIGMKKMDGIRYAKINPKAKSTKRTLKECGSIKIPVRRFSYVKDGSLNQNAKYNNK